MQPWPHHPQPPPHETPAAAGRDRGPRLGQRIFAAMGFRRRSAPRVRLDKEESTSFLQKKKCFLSFANGLLNPIRRSARCMPPIRHNWSLPRRLQCGDPPAQPDPKTLLSQPVFQLGQPVIIPHQQAA